MQSLWYESAAVWSYGLATAAFGGLTALLSLRWRGELRSAFLLGAVLLSACWAGTSLAFALTPSPAMWTTTAIFDIPRSAALATFLFLLFGRDGERSRRQLGRVAGYALVAALAAVVALGAGLPAPGQPATGNGGLLAIGLLLAIAVAGLAAAEQLYRRTPEVLRWNVRPVCLGLGALFIYDLVLYADALLFHAVDPGMWAARGAAHALTVPVLGVAANRNREWSFDVALSRGVLMGSSAVIGAAMYLLFIATLGYYVRYFGGQWGHTLSIALVFAALLLLAAVLLTSTFRSKLRVLIAKHFFAYRYDYREEWLSFTALIASPASGSTIHAQCIAALGNLVETSSGALWVRRDGAYVQAARSTFPAVDEPVAAHSALPGYLQTTGWVIDVPEARAHAERYDGLQLPAWLQSLEPAWLVVPLGFGGELAGFVVLGRPRVDFKLDWEVRDLLKTAGRQAASYLAHTEATELLMEARKFDAFNRMSAFVVHDLKNLVAQLQLMLRNAERHGGNPDFQRDMLKTVEHVVGRMNQLMLQLRAGVQPVARPHAVDLAAVVQRVREVRAAGRRGLTIDVSAAVQAMGHEDRLERVVGHLVQNAFDASDADPEVKLRVFRDGDNAVIEVADRGSGMSPDFVRERLFKPFSSTKQMGMGIGTYESQQYVVGIGGRIEVDSAPAVGTTIRVVLPAASRPVEAGASA